MGSSQEKKDLEKFSSSSEGKSIIKISESFFTQNIYVCGDYDINFFKNNIIEPLRFPKSDVEYCEKIAKHKVIKDWHFFLLIKEKILMICLIMQKILLISILIFLRTI